MEDKKYIDIHHKWRTIGRYKNPGKLELELELKNKILKYFQVGDFYYFTFAPPIGKIELISESVSEVLGYSPREITIEKILDIIHPDDLTNFIDFEYKVVDFKMNLSPNQLMKYKSSYNYRIRKRNGEYIHILQQSITIQHDETGAVLRNLVVHTDISHLKSDNKMALSFIGLEGEPSFKNVLVPKRIKPSTDILTERELEILQLMKECKTSSEIADELFISIDTVKTHRKNIHTKTGTKSPLQAVLLGMENGWL